MKINTPDEVRYVCASITGIPIIVDGEQRYDFHIDWETPTHIYSTWLVLDPETKTARMAIQVMR